MSAKLNTTFATQLLNENVELRIRLAEAEETLNAIRNGEFDAIVVSGVDGEKIFSLTSAETPYRIIIEEINEGAVVLSSEGVILYCNRRFAEFAAVPPEQITGSYFNQYVPKSALQKFNDLLQASSIGKTKGALTSKLKNGEKLLYLHLSFSPLPTNMLGDVCIIVSDISELKQKEEALRHSQKTLEKQLKDLTRMSRIMKNSQEIAHLGSFEYVVSNKTFDWSEEEYHIFGLDPKSPSPDYDALLEKRIHPDDAKILHDTFTKAIQNKKFYELEHRIVRPDGSIRWVYDQAHPYFDENRHLLQYIGATLDITERKQLHQELKKLNAELEFKVKQRTALLEASNKELEAFSYSVSHDLRAPLRHINGYVDLLNSGFKADLPEKARHYLQTISEASSQMGTLIDNLLQYSRNGQKEISKTELDFNELIKEVLGELKSVRKGRKITWDIKKLPKVFGDINLLKLVWTNLLDNAIKYTRKQQTAQITIDYKQEAKEVVFCVSDNGVGFDMKYAHKLFGVFQRLHSQTEFEGTGIGLANVKRIIHKHMGRVWAEAEPEKGAKFYFSLPINLEEIL